MTITPGHTLRTPGMLWLDLTRKCQLACVHCYNSSGPQGDHGQMTLTDWLNVIDQANQTGTRHVQLIGGEPTLHPDAPTIAEHALNAGMSVEVYSNLVHVSPAWWKLLQHPDMSLATSYYSSDPARHNQMTRRPTAHARTRANITRALELDIRLRVAIITPDGQDVDETRTELQQLGVTRIGVDHIRPYGRGKDEQETDCAGLCGACGDNRAAVAPDGTVSPCVFSSWMRTGNVLQEPLADILTSPDMTAAKAAIQSAKKPDDDGPLLPPCGPDMDSCKPGGPPSGCNPRN